MDDYQDPDDIPPRPDPSETVAEDPDEYDALDEASMGSVPASDPIGSVPNQNGRPDRIETAPDRRVSRPSDSGPGPSEAPEEEGSASG